MRVIAIEEHCRTVAAREPQTTRVGPAASAKLDDLGAGRLADMDAAGIDLQVLSQAGSAAAGTDGAVAVALARDANDRMAEVVASRPDRFAAFATLPAGDPGAAAVELERAVRQLGLRGALVNGRPGGLFMDHPSHWPVFECAEALGVPVYLHPAEPPAEVQQAYYDGFRPDVSRQLGRAAWGWHIETGLHALRLILGGVFDRFPRLRVIIGHMLARTDTVMDGITGLQRPVAEYFREHFYVTTSGFFTQPPLLCTLLVLGAEHIIFSVDYPYSTNEEGRSFLQTAPISPADLEKIAHGNAERLLGL
jgi:predicted TIM-barrel fold metal-dependent hydrolase